MKAPALLFLTLLLLGCTPRTEILLGVATNLNSEPDVLERVRFSMREDDVETQRFEWALADRPELGVQLPGSLGIFSGGAEAKFEIVLTGLLKRGAQIERRQRFTLLNRQTRLYRLALLKSCIDVTCPGEQTCIDGRCESPDAVDLSTPDLPPDTIECGDSSVLIDTRTGQRQPPLQAACPKDQRCVEGQCRRVLAPEIVMSPGDTVWARRFGGSGDDSAVAAALDTGGNVTFTGGFQGSVDFGGGALSVDPMDVSGVDTFVTKLSVTAAQRWARRIGGLDLDSGRAVAMNRTGEVAVAGFVRGTVDFGSGPTAGGMATSGFVARYTPAGAPLWANRFNGNDLVSIEEVAVDPLGNVLIGGDFKGTVDLGAGPRTARGPDDLFVAKYEAATGKHLWSRTFGSDAPDIGEYVYGIAVDSAGDVIISGGFYGTVDAGGSPLSSAGQRDILLAKYTGATGAHQWSLRLGGAGDDVASRVAVVPGGDIVLAGGFQGMVRVGATGLTSAGGRDVLLARFSPAGAMVGAQAYGGAGEDLAWGLAADGAGNVAMCGSFEQSINFGGGIMTSKGSSDAFVVRFDPTGAFRWSRQIGGPGEETAFGVALDVGLGGAVLLAGYFEQTVDFGGVNLASAGSADMFVMQLAP